MKKLIMLTVTSLVFNQSNAQSIGTKIGDVQNSVEKSGSLKLDQNLLMMEMYAKKSILASIKSAKDLNKAVGLDTLSDENFVAVPMVAVGALYTSLQAYRMSDYSLQAVAKLASPKKIEDFIKQADELDAKIKQTWELSRKTENKIYSLESEIQKQALEHNKLHVKEVALKRKIKNNQIALDDVYKNLASQSITENAGKLKIAELNTAIEKDSKALTPLKNKLTKISTKIAEIKDESNLLKPLLAELKSNLKALGTNYESHMTMISRKSTVRTAMSTLGSAARGTLLMGGIVLGVYIIADTVILTVSDEDLNKFISQLERDIAALEASI